MLAGANGPDVSRRVVEAVRATGLEAREFYFEERHSPVFEAALALVKQGLPTDYLTLEDELHRRGQLERVGGRTRIRELPQLALTMSNAPHHARLVREAAKKRRGLAGLRAVAEALDNGGVKREELERLVDVLDPTPVGVVLKPLWLRDALERELGEVSEYVTDVLQMGVVAEIAGLPYTYKSALALELASKVAAGKGDLLGRFPIQAQANVAYLWGDDSERNELGRLQDYARRHGFCGEPLAFYLNPPLVLPDGLHLLADEIAQHRYGLVVLDSLYNFAPGLNWTDNAEVTRLYNALKRLCDEGRDLSIVLVDHAPKPSESTRGRHASISSFGSVYKAASVRCSIALEREGDTLWISATGNNVRGFKRSLAVFDEEALELRLLGDQEARDYQAEAVAYISEHPGASQQEVATGIKCRPDAARDALLASAAEGEAHAEQVRFRDAAGRQQTRRGWLPGPDEGRISPDLGETQENAPQRPGHEGAPPTAPLRPERPGGRDGEPGQGGAGQRENEAS